VRELIAEDKLQAIIQRRALAAAKSSVWSV